MNWSMVLDLVRGGLFSLAHFLGGSMGLAIVAASLGFRAIMLPFAIRAARRQAAVPARPQTLDPALAVQLPIGLALYAAIRRIGDRAGGFLWAKTLAQPDRAFAVITALTVGALSWLAGSARALDGAAAGTTAKSIALGISSLIAVGLTLGMLWHLPAGVAVYSVTSSVAGFGERRLVARIIAAKGGASR